jgi:hypothetical protein
MSGEMMNCRLEDAERFNHVLGAPQSLPVAVCKERSGLLDPSVAPFIPKEPGVGREHEADRVTPTLTTRPEGKDAKIMFLEYDLATTRRRMDWLERRNHEFKRRLDDAKDEFRISREVIAEQESSLENERDKIAELEMTLKENVQKWSDEKKRLHDRIVFDTEEMDRKDETIDAEREVVKQLRERKSVLERNLNDAENRTEGWVGRTLKLKFLLDEIKKLGILPEDHAEWVIPMVEDIEIPEVSQVLRRRFLPSHEDAHMEFASDEEEETEYYERLSRAAAEHSAILDGNPEENIAACLTIQRIFRGFAMRKKIKTLYGDNPREKISASVIISASVMIQKIFRGFSSRKILSFTCHPLSHQIHYGPGTGSTRERRGIRFINTGGNIVNIRWVKGHGAFGNPINIEPSRFGEDNLLGTSISTYMGHWFVVTTERLADRLVKRQYIRIPFNFISNSCYDTHTGITLTLDQWKERSTWTRRNTALLYSRPVGPHEDDDDAQLRLAIQMSLEDQQPSNPIDDANALVRNEVRVRQRRTEQRQEREQDLDYGADMGSMFNETAEESDPVLTNDAVNYGSDIWCMFRTQD